MSSANSSVAGEPRARSRGHGTRAWRSLSARLALWYVVVTVASFLAAATVFAIRAEASVQREGARSAEGTLERYRQALESGGTQALESMFACSPGPKLALRLTDQRDVEIFGISTDDAARAAGALGTHGEAPGVFPDWHVAVTQVSQQRRLSVAVHDETAERLWPELRKTSWLIFSLGLGIALIGATLITRRTLRPVTNLALATRHIVESGDLSARVETPENGDELSQLTQLFNRMLVRNEQLVNAMRESLEYVAHDLRTPLTRLRAGAELALHGPADATKEREALADVVEETDRVLAMLTTLTDISEAEAGAMRLDKQPADLAQIAREAVELYEFVSKEAGVTVVTHLTPDVRVQVDRRRLAQVCANLIDNAIKYTPATGRVEVSVFGDGGSAVFRVSDTGVGIATEDRERVWQRLFRADPSRAERGLGLGLSLVKAVVEAHAGQVRLESTPGVGSTFEFQLPIATV